MMSKTMSLLFSIEQWELIRRLRNSGLTKDQICQAFDELDRMDRDLGSLYDIPAHQSTANNFNNNHNSNTTTKQQQQQNDLFAKNFQMLLSKTTNNQQQQQQQQPTPQTHSHQQQQQHQAQSPHHHKSVNNNNNSNNNVNSISTNHHHGNQVQTGGGGVAASAALANSNSSDYNSNNNVSSPNANNLVNMYFANVIDPDVENKQVEEFRSKGEVVIHSEISFFVYKHDLKQSQIARMAGVNQAYVSKFLRGEFFDLSENGKSLIYKWYLRFLKNSSIYLQAHNITLTSNDHTPKTVKVENVESPIVHQPQSSFANVTNTTYDQPKRTRFSFKSEHLLILEKAFIENQYPDQKRREELAKTCNEARPCSEREKVTEQIITHWFQNKRKITRKANSEDQTSPKESNHLNGHILNGSSSMTNNNEDELDYQNSSSPINYQDFIEDPNMISNNNHQHVKSNRDESDGDQEDDDEIIY